MKGKEQFNIVHDYLVNELGFEYKRCGTGSHHHKYFAPGTNRNVVLLADHGSKKKDGGINPSELGKQLSRTIYGDTSRYVEYKDRIKKLLSD